MTCKDCGSKLDVWGICPNADPNDAAVMSAPVNCGGVPHPENCMCQPCYDRREATEAILRRVAA